MLYISSYKCFGVLNTLTAAVPLELHAAACTCQSSSFLYVDFLKAESTCPVCTCTVPITVSGRTGSTPLLTTTPL